MAFLELKGVSKSYGEGSQRTDVLDGVNLEVGEGEFIAIVGFSGSGKTTLINTIAGLVEPDQGEVLLKGQPIRGPSPDRGLVFQSYSLMPWLTVRGNVSLSVDQVSRKETRKQREERTLRYIEMVGLSHAIDRRPAELSGGMRQRVAVARALAMSPEILLLDEPLSALDALTRAKLQDEIELIWEQDKRTVVLITNDVDEAILLADRIIPLMPGPNAKLGTEFKVDIPRPRDRTTIGQDPEFKRLRSAVTTYLIDVASERAAHSDDRKVLPNVVPIDLTAKAKKPPKAYEKAASSPRDQRYLEFSQISKVYPTQKGPLTVVDGFDLKLRKGEFITLIGHSGCGKSTVLSMTAGLNEISSGGIILDGKEVTTAGPDRAVVFQAPSLFPWLTAKENVSLGVDRVYPHASEAERDDIVSYYLDRVGLADAMDKPAVDLSNGMKQRVGIARAFALSPKLLLLDEPFGMLDSLTRWELQEVLMEVWSRTKVTAVCVTHDVDEAILLADRCVMMTNGPNARIGNVMEVNLPRPRTRKALLEHADYYAYRQELLDFLEAYEGGANPSPEVLEAIKSKRTTVTQPSQTCDEAQEAAMTPQDVSLVQSSFAKVLPISDEAGRIFYGRLFNIAPEVRRLFHGDLDEQSRKLMQMLATVVNGLNDLETIVPAAQALARRHVRYGVERTHYQSVGEALIWTLAEGLGEEFDDRTQAAWRNAYAALAGVMIEAAYGDTVRGEVA